MTQFFCPGCSKLLGAEWFFHPDHKCPACGQYYNPSEGFTMANVKDIFYHGIRHQVRRVVQALGDDRTDKGLTAFEDGHSNWSDCFFARALAGEVNLNVEGEKGVARVLGLVSENGMPNLIPVRIVYRTFDSCSTMITRDEMKQLISDIRDESRPDEVMKLLRSINYTDVETTPIPFENVVCAR